MRYNCHNGAAGNIYKQTQRGFTLIEFSMVFVIIAAIAAAIVAGNDLLQQSRLNSVIKQMASFEGAINQFTLKYGTLPGDFDEATAYWPGIANTNGNGNGILEAYVGSTNELHAFWRHLSAADMLQRFYCGDTCSLGASLPESPIRENAVWTVTTGHYLRLSGDDGGDMDDPVISPVDAYTLEKRMEDGYGPDTGKMRAYNGVTGAGTGNCVSGGAYVLSEEDIACYLEFRFDDNR